MITKENRPAGNRAIEAKTDGPFAFSKFTGDIDLTEISNGSPNARFEVYFAGWSAGWVSRQAEIDRLNYTLDRLYVAAFNPVKIDPNRPTYAELERRRGNHEHADQIEADMAKMFGQVSA